MYHDHEQTCVEPLYVVAVVSNPAIFQKRYTLFKEFCARMKSNPKVRLLTVELQQGCRPFQTDSDVKFKTVHELWHKENLINLGVQHLPRDWKYMAWIDADIVFTNERWAEECLDQLQTFSVVQLFTHAIDLGPNKETMQTHVGFAYQYCRGETWVRPGYGKYWHSGYAWAMTREAYDAIGGLLDFAILGSADFHMAMAFIGMVEKTSNSQLHPHYKLLLNHFQERCERHIQRNIGYVTGTILHEFHGSKRNRFYKERWKILVENQFDPLMDIKRDCHGLWQLEGNKFRLRDQLRNYFRSRNEDSIDWE